MIGLPWVYGIRSGSFIKIGAADNIERRRHNFQLGNPHQLTIVLRQMCDEAYWVENRMHKILAPFKYRREWFSIDVKTARSALTQALDDLADKRRKQIAWEIESGQWKEHQHPLASWNGRGIRRPDPVSNWQY